MPELPEVETIRNGLSRNILDKKIKRIEIKWKGSVKSNYHQFVKTLKKSTIKKIDRVGKLLIFVLSTEERYILIHLRMTGQLVYVDGSNMLAGGHKLSKNDLVLPNKHTHIVITFVDGSKLFYSDLRKFGYWTMVDKRQRDEAVSRFGIEPIDKRFTLPFFKEVLKSKKTNIKSLLLNQKYISGIGNIYVDEICFRSSVLSDRPVSSLKDSEIKRLYNNCKYILEKAIESGGTTFKDYMNHRGKKGNFVDQLKVYGRQGQTCKKCKSIIKKNKVAGRGTHYCIKCQK